MSKKISIGVFVPHGAQLLDTACVDVLGVMSKEFISALPLSVTSSPAHSEGLAALAPDVTISYISTPSQGRDVSLTSGMVMRATHDYTDSEVAPGKLDIIVVPGPDPSVEFDEGGLQWLRQQAETPHVDVLSICTGLFICAAAGIVDGKKASGPRGLQDALRDRFPGIRLVGDKERWVQDGNLWSSGGVTNGNDLMAAYARASKRWPQPIVDVGLAMTEVGDRGQFYQ